MDVDIEWQADANEAHEALLDASAYDADDYFVFQIEGSALAPDRLGGSIRFVVVASLAGRQFERFVLDVGFGRRRREAVVRVELPGDFAFADVGPVAIGLLPVERHLAEKVHAYTRTFGPGRTSSRTKDLVDMNVIATSLPVDARQLRVAIDQVFMERGTHDAPSGLPPPPADWVAPSRSMAQEVGISPRLADGHALAAAFLDPVLRGDVEVGTWGPEDLAWQVG